MSSPTDWSSLKVVDLRAELQSRGLQTKGVKADLIKRLTEADAAATQVEESGTEETPAVEGGSPTNDDPEQEASAHQEATSGTQPAADSDAIAKDEAPDYGRTQSKGAAEVDATTSQETHTHTAQPQSNNNIDTLNTLPASDVAVDIQKRKRRSSTPPPSTKRARQEGERQAGDREDVVDFETGDIFGSPKEKSQNGARVAEGRRDEGDVEGAGRRMAEPVASIGSVVDEAAGARDALGDSGEEAYLKRVAIAESSNSLPSAPPETHQPSLDVAGDEALTKRETLGKPSEEPRQLAQPKEELREDRFDSSQQWQREASAEDDGPSLPSIHSPTSALYIRELMRPLRSEMVEQHIVDLVTPQGREPDPNLIEDFYLDQIRTHAFVKLSSVSAAKRVRAGLHNQIWPNERNRKPLWVDFIPPECVREWVDREESGGRGNAPRWEVVYEQDGAGVVAVHREAGSDVKPFLNPPPTGPAAATVYPGIEAAPRGPRGRGAHPQFDSPNTIQTRAYPTLSYQPMSEDIAQRRVDNMRSFYSPNTPRDLGKDYNRYTFENADSFVDRGTEVFIGIRPPHREKEHQERLRRERLGTAGPSSVTESRRDDYRPPVRPLVTDEDRYSDRRPGGRQRNRGYRGDRGSRYRGGEDPYRYRPGR